MALISYIIPVYNGAPMVERLYDRLIPIARSLGQYEIIFVDDGSTDGSFNVLKKIQAKDRTVCAVQLSRNFGQHNSTLAGLSCAQGEIIVTLDQDLQNPPEEIPHLLQKLSEGFDVVYGLPEARAHNIFRNATSNFSKWLSSKILSTALHGNFSSFRVLRKWVVDEILKYRSSYTYIDGLISWTTRNVGGVSVRNDRSQYESHYTFLRLINHGLNLLVNFSIRPLQAASLIGALSALLGLVGAAVVIIEKILYGVPVQGWASLMVVVLVIGGMQMAFLGLIGEYTGRILMNSNSSPKFIIREIKRGTKRNAGKKK
ncbi:MAG TPA: glycosyltransferase family 2 protein [Bacteroidota bacterium]|nr:glycosyltransferase family 2 protein [Bacteroidota bacterium]